MINRILCNIERTDAMAGISAIKDELKLTIDENLPIFINKYREDERSGVQKLVESAGKRYGRYEQELEHQEYMLTYERKYGDKYDLICGIDEAGRGPLAGPVVAGAVILPKELKIMYLNDSKQLTEKKREELYDVIMDQALAVGVGIVSPERIDEINILQATYEAMRKAVQSLKIQPQILLNDAVIIPKIDLPQVKIIKGDAKSLSIAAASVIAKVTRDRMMKEYHQLFPEYGFDQHKGYGSKSHIEAIKKYGPCPIHRRSFITHFTGGK